MSSERNEIECKMYFDKNTKKVHIEKYIIELEMDVEFDEIWTERARNIGETSEIVKENSKQELLALIKENKMSSERNETECKMYFDKNTKKVHIEKYIIELEKDVEFDEIWTERARNIGETSEIVKENAKQELLALIKAEKNLVFPVDNDYQIFRFLRIANFNVTRAFKLVQNFFQFRYKNKHLSNDLLPTVIRDLYLESNLVCFPYRMSNGERTIYLHIGKNWNPSKISPNEILRSIMLVSEGSGYEPYTQISGCYLIVDMEGFTFDKVFSITPSIAKNIVDYLQKSSGSKIIGVILINQPRIFSKVFALFKPFINKKLQHLIHFMGDMNGEGKEKMIEKFGADYLPFWLGGNANWPKTTGPVFLDLLMSYLDLYEENNTWGYKDESVD